MDARRFAAGILVLGLSFFRAGVAQTQADKQENGSTVLKATTRLVVVDVVAANSKGEAVSGLRAQDFKVFENGKEQEIRVFDFQHSGQPSAAPAFTPSKLPANVFNNAPVYSRGSAFNVVLLDVLNTAETRQDFARDELLHFLRNLPSGGPVAIYLLSDGLHMVQDFTDNPEVLRAAAKRLQGKGSALMDNPSGGPPMVVPLPPGIPLELAAALRAKEKEARDFTAGEQVEITLAALSSLAHRLSLFPGRKNLIWISDGFPFYVNLQFDARNYTRQTYEKEASKADTVLMDSQVAIYPVDAHALKVPTIDDIGYGNIHGALGVDQQLGSLGKDFNERLAVHSTMNDLAAETGGEAFYNTNNIEQALRNSIIDGSTYYTVGYYPQDKRWDGKFRKIEVKVARNGVKLRYRSGYYALEPVALAKNQTWSANLHEAMDLNSPVSSALSFQAAVLGPSEKTANKVVVNFGIDPRAINFEKDAGGLQHAALECAVEAYSLEGKLVKADANNLNAALPAEVFARISQSYFPCQQSLDLPPGNYFLRLGVVDNHTGLIGTANAIATVPAQVSALSSK